MIPGVERKPLNKLEPGREALLRLLERWREEAAKAGRMVSRIVLAYEAERDGFWLVRWLRARGIEICVIHPASVAVSREHKRAKTDRLDTAMLLRVFLGWLRGERGHCGMAAVPTLDEEDAKRPSRERESLVGESTRLINRMKGALARLGIRGFKPQLRKSPQHLEALRTPEDMPIPQNTLAEIRRDMARLAMLREQIKVIEQTRLERLDQAAQDSPRAKVLVLARIIGVGVDPSASLRTRTCLYGRFSRGTTGWILRLAQEPWRGTLASPARRNKAAPPSTGSGRSEKGVQRIDGVTELTG